MCEDASEVRLKTQLPALKDRIDFCDRASKRAYTSWNDRRQYEWKLSIALWTVLAVSVGFFTEKGIVVTTLPYLGFATCVFAVYLLWLRGIWRANEFDRRMQFHYDDQARKLLGHPNHQFLNFPYVSNDEEAKKLYEEFEEKYLGEWKHPRGWKFALHYSHLTYLLTVALLLVLAFPFATGKVKPKSKEPLERIEDTQKELKKSLENLSNEIELLRSELNSMQAANTYRGPRTPTGQQPTRLSKP
jgi:hypothetical protein